MKFLAGLAALVSLAAAAPSAPTSLDVKLEMTGNSAVKATITNVGKNNLKLFKAGTILDRSDVQKTRITAADGKTVGFQGIRQRVATSGLKEEAFQRINAGQSIEVTFDVGSVHDLSAGGKYDIQSSGIMQFADENKTDLVGSVPYTSNKINAVVDGAKAASSRQAFRNTFKRSEVQSDCTGKNGDATNAALSACSKLAKAAAAAVQSNDDKVNEYFKDTSDDTKSTLVDVFNKVAEECSTSGGVSKLYCTDVQNGCEEGVLAYTIPTQSIQAYCPLYYSDLPPITSECHNQDQATTNLHETTHLSQIKGTDDLGYGYDAATKLSTADALNNADSYALFANAIYSNC